MPEISIIYLTSNYLSFNLHENFHVKANVYGLHLNMPYIKFVCRIVLNVSAVYLQRHVD